MVQGCGFRVRLCEERNACAYSKAPALLETNRAYRHPAVLQLFQGLHLLKTRTFWASLKVHGSRLLHSAGGRAEDNFGVFAS